METQSCRDRGNYLMMIRDETAITTVRNASIRTIPSLVAHRLRVVRIITCLLVGLVRFMRIRIIRVVRRLGRRRVNRRLRAIRLGRGLFRLVSLSDYLVGGLYADIFGQRLRRILLLFRCVRMRDGARTRPRVGIRPVCPDPLMRSIF
jgi:hypothetical protein